MVQRLRSNSKAVIAAVITAVYLVVAVGLANAHHKPRHNPTPTACVNQGKAVGNPHCVSPSPGAHPGKGKGLTKNTQSKGKGKAKGKARRG